MPTVIASLRALRTSRPSMRFRISARAAALLALPLVAPLAHAQEREKLAQTTMKFLSVSVDPRAAALGDAVAAIEGAPTTLFYNPAGMARQENRASVGVAQTQYIGEVDHNIAAVTVAPRGGRYGVVGVSLQHVNYGEQIGTIRSNNEQGYDEIGTFRPVAFAVGAGYAKALSDRFSVGGQVRYATLDLGDPVRARAEDGGLLTDHARESAMVFDVGMLYKTGFYGLNFAVAARNFASQVSFAREQNRLPLTLNIGVAVDAGQFARLDPSMHRLTVAAENNLAQDYREQIRVGAEYGFMNTLYLRAGYVAPTDEQGVSVGFGVQRSFRGVGLGIDYAYTDFGAFNQFGRVHRTAVRFSF